MENKKIFVYWNCRRETLEVRAKNIYSYISNLKGILDIIDIQLPKQTYLDYIDANKCTNQLLDYLKKSVKSHYRLEYIPDDFEEDIGSAITLKLKLKDLKELTIKALIGSCSTNVPNSIIIESANGLLNNILISKSLFYTTILLFDPLWGTFTSPSLYKELLHQNIDEYWVGWMMYFSNVVKLPSLSSFYSIDRSLKNGIVVFITDEEFDASEKNHIARAKFLFELFRENEIKR